jgi:hypothetical protein
MAGLTADMPTAARQRAIASRWWARKAARNPPLGGRLLMAGTFGMRESAQWRH